MAKKLYVGAEGSGGNTYLTTYYNQTGIDTVINTGVVCKSYIGFEIDFTYYGGTNASENSHYIIHGGRGSRSYVLLSVNNNNIMTFSALQNGAKTSVFTSFTMAPGTRYKISNIINETTGNAYFKIINVDTGTTLVDNSNLYNMGSVSEYPGYYFAVLNDLGYSGTTRTNYSTYMNLYSLKFYEYEDLIASITPVGTVSGEDGDLYDTISQTTLSYGRDTLPKAKYYGGSSGPTAHEASKIYVGVNDEAKEVVKAYVGVNGEAKLFYDTTS